MSRLPISTVLVAATLLAAPSPMTCLALAAQHRSEHPGKAELGGASTIMSCRTPLDAVAATICGSDEYRAMDREIAALADRAAAQLAPGDRSQLAASQARFLRQRMDCGWAGHHSAHPGAAIDECVHASLEGRIRSLRFIVDHGGFEAPMGTATR